MKKCPSKSDGVGFIRILSKKILEILGWLLILPIRFYRKFISPFTSPSCRFVPTCSEYAIEAIKKHGPFKGFWLALRRLLRCRPGGGFGYDPVP